MIKHALPVTRQADFAAWYQSVITEADLAAPAEDGEGEAEGAPA